MHQAIHDLELEHLFIVYPGNRFILIADKMTAISLDYAKHKPCDEYSS